MKKITSLLAVFAMLATLFVAVPVNAETTGFDGTAATAYAGGEGTAENPWQIATPEQLAYASAQINSGADNKEYFILTADIDYNNQEWKPLGASDSAYFSGHFDGDGHVVKNLKITNGYTYVGFFGCLYVGGGRPSVTDLGIENMEIRLSGTSASENSVGGFAAYIQAADITNCYVKNSVVNCADQLGGNAIGAFSGLVRSGAKVNNCYAYDVQINSHINNPIAGFSHQTETGGSELTNCYAAEITLTNDRTAYSVGRDAKSSITAENCWSTLVGGQDSKGSCVAYNSAQAFGEYAADKDTLVSKFDGVEGWTITDKVNGGYPSLYFESFDGTPAAAYAGGDGTEGNPYQIATPEQLAYANAQINGKVDNKAYFVLTEDIDYNNQEWKPLGATDSAYFSGHFDGAGHVVKNIKITTKYTYVGFFGCIYDGTPTVKNLGIENMNISIATSSSPNTIGGFAAYVQGGAVTDCYVKNSSVKLDKESPTVGEGFGAFAGLSRGGSVIENCYAYNVEMDAPADCPAAGFANHRYTASVTFKNCYAAEIRKADNATVQTVYGFGSKNASAGQTEVNCYSTLADSEGVSNSFANTGVSKEILVGQFKNVEGFTVYDKVNNGYPCLLAEVDFAIKSVVTEGNTVTVNVKADTATPATVYVATYDVDGRMVDVKASAVNEADFTFTPEGLTLSTTLKVFVWDADCNPLTNVK